MAKRAIKRHAQRLDSIEQAQALHRTGRLDDAGRICAAVLAADPKNFDALHLAGVLNYQQGRSVEALRQLAAALQTQPGSASALTNYGVVLESLQRHEDALASYDKALAISAGNANLHCNRGNALKLLGRYQEALASYQSAIAAAPDFVAAHVNRAGVLALLFQNEDALASADRALAVLASDKVSADRANQGFAICLIKGKVLTRLKRFADALASYDKALAFKPNDADALANRATVLAELGHCDHALADLAKALRFDPNSFDAYLNRGNVYSALARMDDALADFLAADRLRPDDPDANFNAALALLCMGRFTQGWNKYEHRFKQQQRAMMLPKLPRPIWRGDKNIAGKTIVLVAEQGMGDAIQFARYAPLVAACGARVVLGVHKPLARLMESIPGVTQIVADGDTLPDFDMYCSLLSLPLAFETELASIPSTVPYLRADAARIEQWRRRLRHNGQLRVGVCWGGSAAHVGDRRRSIAFEQFATLLTVPGIDFVSLQKDINDTQAARLRELGVIQLGQHFEDFSDTAAVVAQLDLVISVDTSVAHLAGAMAKAVAVLIAYSPDWRWMLHRSDSPWYPTMRLFRQTALGDWSETLERLRCELVEVARRPITAG